MSCEFTFSIITPNLNQGQYLEQNINSVISQQQLTQQLILDGQSTDESQSILQKYDDKLFHWVSEKDSGQSNAINKGLTLATGKYVTWLNADDYYLPNSFEVINAIFDQSELLAVVHGSSLLVDSSNNEHGYDHGQAYGLPYRYYAGMCFPQPASFIRASVLNKIGLLSENLHYGMDYELFLRIKLQGFRFCRIDHPFAAYRLHPSSKTVSAPLRFADEWIQIYNNFLHGEKHSSACFRLLKVLNLYRDATNEYDRLQFLEPEPLKKTLLYALHYQAYFRFQAQQYSIVRKIIRLMLAEFPFTRLSLPLTHMYLSSKRREMSF